MLLTMLIIAFTAVSASAQQCHMIGFVRPGEQNVMRAYLPEFVDIMPRYPNGEAAMSTFINRERQYPRDAFEAGVQGRVKCSFIVDTDGTILNVTVLRAPCKSLGNEAARIIQCMPRWESGKIGDISVPVYCVLTIAFRL